MGKHHDPILETLKTLPENSDFLNIFIEVTRYKIRTKISNIQMTKI